jgi:excisionase family DNA binding protein
VNSPLSTPAREFPARTSRPGNFSTDTPAALRESNERNVTAAKLKATAAWQDSLWQRWPREECWPAKMDIYEAAAYLRVSPDTIRRAVVVARDGRAKLAHQRLGSIYRIRKIDLDGFGMVPGRELRA